MNSQESRPMPLTTFVIGATGLLGNNLVRLLLERGLHVKALARSAEKARKQFGALPIEIELGLQFRPVEETLRDEVAWHRDNGWLPAAEIAFPRNGAGRDALQEALT